MAYKAYVVKVEQLRPHTNADKLQIATFFGNDTCVNLDVKIGEIGIYFPSDGQLSEEFCQVHDLVRRKDENGNPTGGYLDPDKRNIKAIRLRGEKSDGIFMPLSCLAYTGINLDDIKVGDTIDVVNGYEICKKYIPKGNRYTRAGGNRTRKKKINIAPLFAEHADTEQLAYNLSVFKPGDEIEITLKMHGTSQRTGYLPVIQPNKTEYDTIWKYYVDQLIPFKSLKQKFKDKFGKPVYDYGYVSGTRRTVLENYEGGYYGSNTFREQHSKVFEGKLWKGESVYYEVVSFTDDGTPIMSKGNVPKEARSQYGTEMVFHYGRSEGSDIYVYRMTMTNEDGDVVEYTPDFMRYRCGQMGVKTVPVFAHFTIGNLAETEDGDLYHIQPSDIQMIAEQYYDGPDPIGKTHIREGVVIRIINRPKFCAYKHKNFLFKQISGIISEAMADSNETVSDDILSEM